MSEKYPQAGCVKGYFIDTDSVQVARGRVALFAGFVINGKPDRTMSALLIGAANSIDELRERYPRAFDVNPA